MEDATAMLNALTAYHAYHVALANPLVLMLRALLGINYWVPDT